MLHIERAYTVESDEYCGDIVRSYLKFEGLFGTFVDADHKRIEGEVMGVSAADHGYIPEDGAKLVAVYFHVRRYPAIIEKVTQAIMTGTIYNVECEDEVVNAAQIYINAEEG